MNETTQQEKTTQLSSRNEQLNSATGTKQLNSPERSENISRNKQRRKAGEAQQQLNRAGEGREKQRPKGLIGADWVSSREEKKLFFAFPGSVGDDLVRVRKGLDSGKKDFLKEFGDAGDEADWTIV
ncbi:hypothetical protein TNCV_1702261 [Trichonephila clavipes]|nr:hypothetical protein TNCV_1702261 [Trichonephila clavipes]